jgi:hypothetical protein
MPVTELYVKLVTAYPRDPKVRALARYGIDGVLARDLYVQMLLYCRENMSDGFVPAEEVGVLAYPVPVDHANQLAKQPASVGLTKEVSKNEAPAWQVLGYLKRNPSREEIEALSKVRAEAGRTGGKKSRKPAQRTSKATGKQVGNQNAEQNGSIPVSVSVSENQDRDRDIQTPTVSAGETAGVQVPTETQRSKQITDAYHAAVNGMCKWAAVNGVVLSAIRSGHFADDEIREAVLRLAAQNRSVTIETLRIELVGLSAQPQRGPRTATTDQRVADAQALKAQLAAERGQS